MVCEFYGSNGSGFGYIWWTDNPIYFSSIDGDVGRTMNKMVVYDKTECMFTFHIFSYVFWIRLDSTNSCGALTILPTRSYCITCQCSQSNVTRVTCCASSPGSVV